MREDARAPRAGNESSGARTDRPGGSRSPQTVVQLIGMAATIAWLVLVGASYAALFLFPEPPNSSTIAPPPPDLSPAYLPLLAALLIPGIIRQLPGARRGASDEGDH